MEQILHNFATISAIAKRNLFLLLILVFLGAESSATAQNYREWTGSGSNWSTAANWNPSGITFAQLEWKGNGQQTSNNDIGAQSHWRMYFSGSKAYTLTGNTVNLFDNSSAFSWILNDATVSQNLNLNINFSDAGARYSYITNRSSGSLTFGSGSNVGVTGASITALRIAGNNTAAPITFNGTISGSKPIDIGRDDQNADQVNTRVVFNGNNSSYTGVTTLYAGTLTIPANSALGSGLLILGNSVAATSTLAVTTSTTRSQGIQINNTSSAAVIDVASGQTFELTGVLSGGATNTTKIGKSGPGILTLTGTATYNGQLQIGDGSVIANNNTAISTNTTTSARGVDLGLNVGDTPMANNVSLLANNGFTVGNSIYVAANTSNATRTIGLNGSGAATFSAQIYTDGDLTLTGGSGSVTINGDITSPVNNKGIIVTGGTVILGGANTYTGNTTVIGGKLQLGAASRIADASNVVLGAGTLSTGASVGFSETVGTLTLTASTASTINLGSGSHALTFANSSSLTPWAIGSTLTITGWAGTAGQSNTAGGRIFFGNTSGGLNAAQLAKISFTGFGTGAIILSTGEIVPPLPSISGATTTAAFTTTYGSPSTAQTFTVSGANLTANLVATAPTGFEVSSDGITYGSTATFTPTSGTASGSLSIRLAATAAVSGSYNSQNIVLSSTGATSANIITAASGNAVNKATPTLTTAPTATGIAEGQTLANSTLSGGVASVAGTFTFTTPSTAPTATASQSVTFTPSVTANYNTFTTTVTVTVTSTTWSGSAWSNSAPTSTVDAIINGTYSTTTNGTISAKSLTVNATKTLTINSGTNVTVQNAVTNNGTLTIENNANLIQVNDVSNTGSGTTTVKRNSNSLKRLDYTMWSSPVTGSQTLLNFSPLTSASAPSIRFYTYNSANNVYSAATVTSTFATGTGYLIRMPNVNPATQVALASDPYFAGTTAITYAGSFTGTLNNGIVTLSGLTSGKYYSIGNPYPSTISANAFIDGNSTAGTLYFWRKTNGTNGTAYATYTKLGATSGSGGITPNGTIQVGQGFLVKAVGSSLSFTNAMRTANNADQFLKTKKVTDKSRLWLDLSDAAGTMNQVLIGYLDGATLGFDAGIDGKYFNDSKTALTSTIDSEEYVIQGRPTFDATDVVALGFKTDVAGDYKIALNSFDGVFESGQDVYLVDAVAGKEIDLKAGSYSFTATVGIDNARFSLKYQKTLKVDAPAFNENSVKVFKNNGSIVVNSAAKVIKTIAVYDVQGRLIVQQKNVNAATATISNLKAVSQVLIVKVSVDDNSVVTKKVLN